MDSLYRTLCTALPLALSIFNRIVPVFVSGAGGSELAPRLLFRPRPVRRRGVYIVVWRGFSTFGVDAAIACLVSGTELVQYLHGPVGELRQRNTAICQVMLCDYSNFLLMPPMLVTLVCSSRGAQL